MILSSGVHLLSIRPTQEIERSVFIRECSLRIIPSRRANILSNFSPSDERPSTGHSISMFQRLARRGNFPANVSTISDTSRERLIRRHLRLAVESRSSLRAFSGTYETCAARGSPASPIPRRSAIRSIGVKASASAGGCSELQQRAATPTRRHARITLGATSHFTRFTPLDPRAVSRFIPLVDAEGTTTTT